MRKLGKTLFIITSAFSFLIIACGGSAIGDAQEFSPNEPPSIISIKAVNFDGSEITQLDIEPYKQFKLIVEAVDPDNNPLEYKFDSASGTFAGIISNPKGCTAVFKTGSIKGGQNIELWAMVSDGNGAIVRQSYNLGTGKLGPAITAVFDKTIFKPNESIKLSVTANCSGFFQLNCDGNKNFDFEKDMYRYSYSPNKTTDFILGGPEFTSYADMQLKPRSDNKYTHKTIYELVLVFRDGLLQTSNFPQDICVDGTGPKVDGFSPDIKDPFDFNPEIIVTFDEDIGYADSSCLELTQDHGKIKLLRISKNQAFFSVTGLKALSDYSATVRRVKDIAGNVMEDSAPYSFKTISGDLQIKDDKENTNFAAYRGFEESSLNLKAYFKNDEIDIAQVALSVESPSNGISVDSAGKVTINPRDLTNEEDVTVRIKAYQSSTEETSYYTVTVYSYYPVKMADDFSENGNIRKNLNGRFKLMEDIVFSDDGSYSLNPIGSYTNETTNNPFTGIFDGNDKTLSNFNIQADKNYAGLFALNKGTIKNLNVDEASFNNGNIDYVGIICGKNEETIDDCDVSNSNINARSVIGIICGQNYTGTVSNCNISDISISAVGSAGGIIGSNNGVIEACTSATASDKDISTTSANAGGIVGVAFGGKISNSSSTAVVNSPDGDNIGGIAGWVNSNSSDNEITDCHHNTGKVSGRSSVGGLIGRTDKVSISYCDSSNEVISTSQYTGGLIGYASDVIILNCSSAAKVQGSQSTGGLLGFLESTGSISKVNIDNCNHNGDSVTGTSQVGGLIGFINNNSSTEINVKDCYSTSNVSSTGNYTGGLVGWVSSPADKPAVKITSCYHLTGSVTGINNVGGFIGAVGKAEITGTTYADCVVSGNECVGGLIGRYNLTSSLSITGVPGTLVYYIFSSGTVKGNRYVGGLIGQSAPGLKAEYCCSFSNIRVNNIGTTYFGGLIGYLSGLSSDIAATYLKNCYSNGYVGYTDDNWSSLSKYVGGLIGFMQYATIKDCYSGGSILSGNTMTLHVGGLVGAIEESSKVIRCYHKYGAVWGKNNVGGLIGQIFCFNSGQNTVEECFADSEVRANEDSSNNSAGGLIGYMDDTDVINCYSRGSVWCGTKAGGLIGCIDNQDTCTILKCYSDAAVYVSSMPRGELIGSINTSSGSVSYQNSIYLNRGYGSSFGSSRTQEQMPSIGTYSSFLWSIGTKGTPDKTWWIDSAINGGFPYLANIPEDPQK